MKRLLFLLPLLFSAPAMAQASETPEQATGSEVAYGIDISEFQGHIDWDRISKSGLDFIYIRASEALQLKI